MPSVPPTELRIARLAALRYELGEQRDITFVRRGENTVFRIVAGGGSYALRVHRPGYQSAQSLRSELVWALSLRSEGLRTAAPLPARDGSLEQLIEDGTTSRLVSVTHWVDGVPLSQIDRLELWYQLGALAATLHDHSRGWRPPAGFTRPAWDANQLVGADPRWGDPVKLGRWSNKDARLLAHCQAVVRCRLAAIPRDARRYGLIHADLSFDNVLVANDGSIGVIDFDDSGYGWYLYDLAAPLYPFERQPGFAERRDALVAGYRSVAPLDDDELAELPTFLMARRLATLGWTFTRGDTAHGRQQQRERVETCADAARRFLDWVAYRRATAGAPRAQWGRRSHWIGGEMRGAQRPVPAANPVLSSGEPS